MTTQRVCESPLGVVDFSDENMKPGGDAWLEACKVVRRGFEEHGCFLARYDKVGPHLLNSVYYAMEQLFGLPLETKRKKTSDKPNHGYTGQVPASPLFESFAIDNPSSIEDCQKFTHVMWPEGNHRLCESVNEYAKLLKELDQTVKKMVFDSYDLDKLKCESFLESTNYAFRSYKYKIPEMDESNVGVNSHTDSTFITILHQRVDGLEVKLKDGEWFGVDASPLFCVMAGDAFMVWSSERIRACEHRVILKSKVMRYSLGLLSYSTKKVQTLEDLVDEEHPIRYKPFDHYAYVGFRFTEEAVKCTSRIKAFCGI
ncbi:2-oxoglutarate-dependent dioxygenase AOP3 [Cajanus cajan]|uniref:Gibberellin 20 oxidase 1-B n=1 Tax=Cajanus cajan TaxID=3821 RepID=A0A151SZU5_CAJCA|nr:2-oxoglutarate-dependent dioxygenase AOP3 [Cajanus cajan]XP_029128842.1 2-oxoglutarate-dependent dioxygenase AOP3 [Cajanus cajan]KYP60309.1 Gibberellin 20 oxidase 1-B [Cajanus cajan]